MPGLLGTICGRCFRPPQLPTVLSPTEAEAGRAALDGDQRHRSLFASSPPAAPFAIGSRAVSAATGAFAERSSDSCFAPLSCQRCFRRRWLRGSPLRSPGCQRCLGRFPLVLRLQRTNSEKTDVDHSTLSPTELKTITPVKLNFLDAKTETLCKADCTHFSGCARGPWHCLRIERKRGAPEGNKHNFGKTLKMPRTKN